MFVFTNQRERIKLERSSKILSGINNQYYRATMKSMGFSTNDLKKPIIGIANAWSECVPGHYNLRQVAQRVKDGIYQAGGTPVEFGVIGGCDGMGQGHDGMHYILPSRELIANSIESMAQINLFDGLVLLGSCDKIVPGMLMAAARLDIPCIFLPGGPMEGGVQFDGRQSDQTSSAEALGMLSAGKITEDEYKVLEDLSCPSCGSCSYLGTANTMCSLSEALGMCLPDGGIIPATSATRFSVAEATGIKIMELVQRHITARKIITNDSMRNAIKVCLAMSGSTNAVMHLTAIAHEAELSINVLQEFDSLSDTTPQVAKINPASKYNMTDFYHDGGVYRMMKEMRSILATNVMTVTGMTLGETIDNHIFMFPHSHNVIHTLKDPFGYTGVLLFSKATLLQTRGLLNPGLLIPACTILLGKRFALIVKSLLKRQFLRAKYMKVMLSLSVMKALRADLVCAKCLKL